jgi:predicted enzyme related to lactoylglutathione lyase
MTTQFGKFVWFEYVSGDAKKAQGFYGEVFGWRVQDVPMGPTPYQMIAVGDKTVGGYAPAPDAKVPPHWLSHLHVENTEKSVADVKRAGGAVQLAPTKIGDYGAMAIVTDPLGGALSLWQSNKPDETGDTPADGHFVWNELWTKDPDKSVAFYKTIAGYGVDTKDMGPMGTYHLFTVGGVPIAGAMKSSMPNVPQMWLPYVQVASADKTIERAKKLGAEIVVPPTDVPEVGRFAIFKDTLGAVLGIIQQPKA